MANPSQVPVRRYGQCAVAVTVELVVIPSRSTNRNKQSQTFQHPPAIRFYPQRLPTTHVPSQDNHATGVREVSEHTVCLVFHSQVTGHCTQIPLAIAARALINY